MRTADELMAAAVKLMAEAEKLRAVPEVDPFADGAVLTFTKNGRFGEKFNYAALRAAGAWYTTGRYARPSWTWAELVEFIGLPNLESIKVVSAVRPLADAAADAHRAVDGAE